MWLGAFALRTVAAAGTGRTETSPVWGLGLQGLGLWG